VKIIIVCQVQNRRMSLPLGIEFEGALYHVTSRGNARHMIYKDDKQSLALSL
jgi:hypothetical protein